MRIIISIAILIAILAIISLSSPPAVRLQSFTISRDEVPGGIEVTGTLTLSRGAPKQGATVMIEPIDPAVATLPASVHFNQGQSVKQFVIIGVPRCDQAQIDIRCTLGTSLSQMLTIRAPHFSIALDPNPVIGGNPVTGTITFDGPAPNCP